MRRLSCLVFVVSLVSAHNLEREYRGHNRGGLGGERYESAAIDGNNDFKNGNVEIIYTKSDYRKAGNLEGSSSAGGGRDLEAGDDASFIIDSLGDIGTEDIANLKHGNVKIVYLQPGHEKSDNFALTGIKSSGHGVSLSNGVSKSDYEDGVGRQKGGFRLSKSEISDDYATTNGHVVEIKKGKGIESEGYGSESLGGSDDLNGGIVKIIYIKPGYEKSDSNGGTGGFSVSKSEVSTGSSTVDGATRTGESEESSATTDLHNGAREKQEQVKIIYTKSYTENSGSSDGQKNTDEYDNSIGYNSRSGSDYEGDVYSGKERVSGRKNYVSSGSDVSGGNQDVEAARDGSVRVKILRNSSPEGNSNHYQESTIYTKPAYDKKNSGRYSDDIGFTYGESSTNYKGDAGILRGGFVVSKSVTDEDNSAGHSHDIAIGKESGKDSGQDIDGHERVNQEGTDGFNNGIVKIIYIKPGDRKLDSSSDREGFIYSKNEASNVGGAGDVLESTANKGTTSKGEASRNADPGTTDGASLKYRNVEVTYFTPDSEKSGNFAFTGLKDSDKYDDRVSYISRGSGNDYRGDVDTKKERFGGSSATNPNNGLVVGAAGDEDDGYYKHESITYNKPDNEKSGRFSYTSTKHFGGDRNSVSTSIEGDDIDHAGHVGRQKNGIVVDKSEFGDDIVTDHDLDVGHRKDGVVKIIYIKSDYGKSSEGNNGKGAGDIVDARVSEGASIRDEASGSVDLESNAGPKQRNEEIMYHKPNSKKSDHYERIIYTTRSGYNVGANNGGSSSGYVGDSGRQKEGFGVEKSEVASVSAEHDTGLGDSNGSNDASVKIIYTKPYYENSDTLVSTGTTGIAKTGEAANYKDNGGSGTVYTTNVNEASGSVGLEGDASPKHRQVEIIYRKPISQKSGHYALTSSKSDGEYEDSDIGKPKGGFEVDSNKSAGKDHDNVDNQGVDLQIESRESAPVGGSNKFNGKSVKIIYINSENEKSDNNDDKTASTKSSGKYDDIVVHNSRGTGSGYNDNSNGEKEGYSGGKSENTSGDRVGGDQDLGVTGVSNLKGTASEIVGPEGGATLKQESVEIIYNKPDSVKSGSYTLPSSKSSGEYNDGIIYSSKVNKIGYETDTDKQKGKLGVGKTEIDSDKVAGQGHDTGGSISVSLESQGHGSARPEDSDGLNGGSGKIIYTKSETEKSGNVTIAGEKSSGGYDNVVIYISGRNGGSGDNSSSGKGGFNLDKSEATSGSSVGGGQDLKTGGDVSIRVEVSGSPNQGSVANLKQGNEETIYTTISGSGYVGDSGRQKGGFDVEKSEVGGVSAEHDADSNGLNGGSVKIIYTKPINEKSDSLVFTGTTGTAKSDEPVGSKESGGSGTVYTTNVDSPKGSLVTSEIEVHGSSDTTGGGHSGISGQASVGGLSDRYGVSGGFGSSGGLVSGAGLGQGGFGAKLGGGFRAGYSGVGGISGFGGSGAYGGGSGFLGAGGRFGGSGSDSYSNSRSVGFGFGNGGLVGGLGGRFLSGLRTGIDGGLGGLGGLIGGLGSGLGVFGGGSNNYKSHGGAFA